MSESQDFLVSEDAVAMELDGVEADEDLDGSRPATSATGDMSSIEEDLEANSDAGSKRERPASLPERGIPLSDSYTWISPRPTADGPYAVGVDEAGRGPALGPLVYGMAFCPVAFMDEELKSMGFDGRFDSCKRIQ
jgi:Ribonuclease HII